MYLLDTNIISYWMRGDKRVIVRIKKHAPSNLALSTVTLAEILYGIEKSPMKKGERGLKIKQISSLLELYSFDEAAAGKYAVNSAQYHHLIHQKLLRSYVRFTTKGTKNAKVKLLCKIRR